MEVGDPETDVRGAASANVYVANSSNLTDWLHDSQGRCIMSVLFQSEDQGQVDIEALLFNSDHTKTAFAIYYMKIEDVTTTLVTSRTNDNHNDDFSNWGPGNPWDATSDVTSADWNVSEDVLVRVRVRGWFTNGNPSGRPRSEEDQYNILPQDRWVMPDDWVMLAGGPDVAYSFRPEYDIMVHPDSGFTCADWDDDCAELQTGVDSDGDPIQSIGHVTGPYSVLDVPGNNTAAPCSTCQGGGDDRHARNTILRDGEVDWFDAPMPPALLTVDISGSGWLKVVDKISVYYDAGGDFTNPFYQVEIPASPLIAANVLGGGYYWDSWGPDADVRGAGPYFFWIDDLTAAPTNTDSSLVLYSDNHGEVMVVANGDFNLSYVECADNPFGGPHCDLGDVVGTSTIWATADYPDFPGQALPGCFERGNGRLDMGRLQGRHGRRRRDGAVQVCGPPRI